jgi:hypothetical protein
MMMMMILFLGEMHALLDLLYRYVEVKINNRGVGEGSGTIDCWRKLELELGTCDLCTRHSITGTSEETNYDLDFPFSVKKVDGIQLSLLSMPHNPYCTVINQKHAFCFNVLPTTPTLFALSSCFSVPVLRCCFDFL